MGSMRELSEAPWKELLEPLIVFDPVLAQDPAKAYIRMDFQSRELYRHTVTHFAEHSDCSELEIAQHAIDLTNESVQGSAGRSAAGLAKVARWLLLDRRGRKTASRGAPEFGCPSASACRIFSAAIPTSFI